MENLKTDITLMKKAIRGQWNITTKIKSQAVNVLEYILEQQDNIGDDRELQKLKLEAIKIAGMLDKIDLKEEEMHTPRQVEITKRPTDELLQQLSILLERNPQLSERFKQLKQLP